MSDGPGIGTIIGLQMGDASNERAFQFALNQLQRRLKKAQTDELVQKAQKDSAESVLAAVMQEIASIDKGPAEPGTLKGFCLPQRPKVRTTAFIETASKMLFQLSSGALRFKSKRIDHIPSLGKEISALRLLTGSDAERC